MVTTLHEEERQKRNLIFRFHSYNNAISQALQQFSCLGIISVGGFVIKVSRDILLVGCCVLVLLVLGNKIVQVRLGLGELHLVHTLASVPMEERLATEHDCELIGDTLPSFLDGGRVSDEDTRHFESLGRDVANGCLEVVGDPLDKVRRMLGGHLKHLVVDFLARHGSTEHHGAGEVASVARIGGAHHVSCLEGLLCELGHGQDTESLGAEGGQRGESNQEEVKTWERNHVDGKLSEIAVELTRETERASGSSDGVGDQLVEIAVGWVGELEGAEANIVQSFVIKRVTLVGILDKLMDGKGGVVWLDHSVGDLGRWNDTVCTDDTVGEFLLDFGDEKSTHSRSGSSSHGMGDLESLEDVASFGFLANAFHDRIYEFRSFGVVAFGPVVTGSALSKDEVVGAEEGSIRTCTDGIHGTGFQIGKDGTWDVTVD